MFLDDEGEEIEYAEDELAHIKIPEIEPRYMNFCWLMDKGKRERFLQQASDSASHSLQG